MNNENPLIQASEPPGAPAKIEEYRIRLNAFYAAQQNLRATGKCHVCGQKSAWYKLCPACRVFLKRPDQIARYAEARDYMNAAIVQFILTLIFSLFTVFMFGNHLVYMIFFFPWFFFFFVWTVVLGNTITQVKKVRAIHGYCQGGDLAMLNLIIFGTGILAGVILLIFKAIRS